MTSINRHKAKRVLIAEDNIDLGEMIKTMLESRGYEAVHFVDRTEALRTALEEYFDVVIVDYRMPGVELLEFLTVLRTRDDFRPIMLMTADQCAYEIASRYGIGHVLQKPFDTEYMLWMVERLAHNPAKRKERGSGFLPVLRL